MSLLGIDVGTTGCKAAVFGEDGRSIAGAYREYPAIHAQDGWAELDSRHVLDCIKQTIAEVTAEWWSRYLSLRCRVLFPPG